MATIENTQTMQEKLVKPMSGGVMLLVCILGWAVSIACLVWGCCIVETQTVAGIVLICLFLALLLLFCILAGGLKIIHPNEARVFTLFGKYYGTIKEAGWYYVHPFAASFAPGRVTTVQTGANGSTTGKTTTVTSPAISLKQQTLDNKKQKVNDVDGNPIIIGAVVIWRVVDPTQAVFSVENYREFLNIQTDSTIRNVARLYPYDSLEEDADGDGVKEKTLRGSSQEIAQVMQQQLQSRVEKAGLEIEEVRITHLAYAEEIAAAMLQRQQAAAIVAARQKIVDGAVGMVKMALDKLGEEEIVVLDEERKAAMVSNLLVVLCGNKDAQPIVNSGSIY
ncbi:MAG TPA: SPFH domain-containing protein [Candidatus Egerieicola faecale]|uniref:SPFH domain-containing protein n=1 Tax=Candidatus Egerieicola faecale TaxID=2840774 RepID=A0A9D1ITV7_9FIRM|nr:SPFH domain-containing protein [Candidatus Egerieicola faecale]